MGHKPLVQIRLIDKTETNWNGWIRIEQYFEWQNLSFLGECEFTQ